MLVDGGSVIIFVPDVEDVKPNYDVLYVSAGGPICGMDLFYGPSYYVEQNPYYAHHTCFTKDTLTQALIDAGFRDVTVIRVGDYNLMGVGKK